MSEKSTVALSYIFGMTSLPAFRSSAICLQINFRVCCFDLSEGFHSPRQHLVEEAVGAELRLLEGGGALADQLLQVGRVALHHLHHVVHQVHLRALPEITKVQKYQESFKEK